MNTTKPEPRMVHTVEQPTAVVHEIVPMSALTEFFGRAFGAVMAAAQAQHASWRVRLLLSTEECPLKLSM
jgi:hypothetical protein